MIGKPYSENIAQLIDKKVQDMLLTVYENTKTLLLENKDELKKLAQLLLNKEVVYQKDLEIILGKRHKESTVNI
jgi:cell division protease FtsH